MAKYDALERFLLGCNRETVTLSFSDIEQLLGAPLPRSAFTYREWWANGGHVQSYAWLNSGFSVDRVDFSKKTVSFRKSGQPRLRPVPTRAAPQRPAKTAGSQVSLPPQAPQSDLMTVCGYPFRFLQELVPERENGQIREYYPQSGYKNKDGLPLLYHGRGAFCRFTVDAPPVSGVYLWVNQGKILYIGETADLRQRFNVGYGSISPRNCYLGGQSTNCKMNKVVLEYAKRDDPIRLYFYPTPNYKQVELELLHSISTKYNVKDN